MSPAPRPDASKIGFLLLGFLAAVGLLGYAFAYLIVMPAVSPTAFVPTSSHSNSGAPALFGMLQAGFILLYALAFLPVAVMFTVKHSRSNPYPLIFAGSLLCLSLLIEILNNLPVLASHIYPARLANIAPDVLLYLRQADAIRYLSYDVAGFSIAYAAIFVYALVYFRSRRWLSYTILGSIAAFIANVPFLWIAPDWAVILMSISMLAFATLPVFMAKMAVDG